MALHQLTSFPISNLIRLPPPTGRSTSIGNLSSNQYRFLSCQVGCMIASKTAGDQSVVRRSEITLHKQHKWDYDFIQSLTNKYVGEPYIGQANLLKVKVRKMLEKAVKPVDQLELIDILQRLGLAYHFESEIKRILEKIFNDNFVDQEISTKQDDLYASALKFRLLRQHGCNVPQEAFIHFKDEEGNFKACLCSDMKGILHLYEASYLLVEGENILEDARDFAKRNLEKYLNQCSINTTDQHLCKLVSHALEAPLHWRMLGLEARWFIDIHESYYYMEPILLEFAKLNFNMVQSIYQEDLKYSFRWWENTGIGKKLNFARDWLMENYFAAAGMIVDPRFSYGRRMQTKINQLLTTMDDIYDIYGTLGELELLTEALVSWDIKAMDKLPHYMRLFFQALFNYVNELAYDILKDQGTHVLPYLTKALADLSKSYLLEAKWYYSGYTPTLEEYLDNAWVSIGVPAMLVYAYFCITNPIKKEALQSLEEEYPNIIRWSSMILRLEDDLATATGELRRGDVAKSIQCYIHDTGASEEEARDHIRFLISETWKKINRDRFASPMFSQTFAEVVVNFARVAHCAYGHLHDLDAALLRMKDNVTSLFILPI